MCARYLRMLLIVVGAAMLLVAAFPVLLVMRLPEAWETTFMGAKLLMLPVGAACLIAAAMIKVRRR